jgi:hypothetical protein
MGTSGRQSLSSLKIRIQIDPKGRIGHGKIRLFEACRFDLRGWPDDEHVLQACCGVS